MILEIASSIVFIIKANNKLIMNIIAVATNVYIKSINNSFEKYIFNIFNNSEKTPN